MFKAFKDRPLKITIIVIIIIILKYMHDVPGQKVMLVHPSLTVSQQNEWAIKVEKAMMCAG